MLPLTRAGIIFQHGMAIGKFQGVMSPATPMGSRMLIAHLSGSSEGTVSPNIRRPSPAMRNAMSMPSWTSPRASSRTLPISRVIGGRAAPCAPPCSAPKRYRISPRFGRRRALPASRTPSSAARMAFATSAPARLEAPHDVAGVGGVDALEGPPLDGVDPPPGDEQLVRGDGRRPAGAGRGGVDHPATIPAAAGRPLGRPVDDETRPAIDPPARARAGACRRRSPLRPQPWQVAGSSPRARGARASCRRAAAWAGWLDERIREALRAPPET